MSSPSTSELGLIGENSTINARVDSGGNNEIGTVNRSKMAKFKNTMKLKEPRTRFLILEAKLAFAEL